MRSWNEVVLGLIGSLDIGFGEVFDGVVGLFVVVGIGVYFRWCFVL